MAIDFESFDTWPPNILTELERFSVPLAAYEHRQRELLEARRSALYPEFLYLHNDFEAERNRVIQTVNQHLVTAELIGYHCTRLLPHEARAIKDEGLQPLSLGFLRNRIERAVTCGALTRHLARELLASNEASEPYRSGIWFVNLKSILREEGAVIRLFRSWGGEALYNRHEERPDTGPVMRRIGTPYIVVAKIAVSHLKLCCNLGEKFANAFLQNLSVETEQGADFESHVCESVPGELIPFSDPRFEHLTSCSKWRERIAEALELS